MTMRCRTKQTENQPEALREKSLSASQLWLVFSCPHCHAAKCEKEYEMSIPALKAEAVMLRNIKDDSDEALTAEVGKLKAMTGEMRCAVQDEQAGLACIDLKCATEDYTDQVVAVHKAEMEVFSRN